jgi:diguanylate cyclase (GGDEF)-like protein
MADPAPNLRDEDREAAGWAEVRLRAERDRERAAIDRGRAAHDRAQAAEDRLEAVRERTDALRLRRESAGLLRKAATDELTGARTRYLGLDEATRELVRARRTGQRLTLAFVDVDGLKRVNDGKGHLAGDALLRAVGEALRDNLRPYDVIVRYGGDEFLCVMPNISAPDARARFEQIAHTLAAAGADYSISMGLAQARHGESLEGLIARADAELLRTRSRSDHLDEQSRAIRSRRIGRTSDCA